MSSGLAERLIHRGGESGEFQELSVLFSSPPDHEHIRKAPESLQREIRVAVIPVGLRDTLLNRMVQGDVRLITAPLCYGICLCCSFAWINSLKVGLIDHFPFFFSVVYLLYGLAARKATGEECRKADQKGHSCFRTGSPVLVLWQGGWVGGSVPSLSWSNGVFT
jgi:hypothetical protein